MKTPSNCVAFLLFLVSGAHAQDYKSTYSGDSGLNQAAQGYGKYFGTATEVFYDRNTINDTPYMSELKNTKDFGCYTATNSMKWDSTEPNSNQFNYGNADQLVSLVKSTGGKLRCHAFVWHNQAPNWVQNLNSNASLLDAITNHVTNLMTHFKDDCYAWDVVNEVVDDNGGYRNSFWYQKTGPSYIAHAFTVADKVRKQLGLKSKLYYNDYSIEWVGSAKTNFAQKMVKGLIDQGVKIDGVGMQAHFEVGNTPSKDNLKSVMKVYTDMGLDVAFTELDIRTDQNPSVDKQKQQGKDYASVVGACKETERCVGVTLWDFVDGYSWVPGTFSGKGYATPWYQAGGKGSALTRKGCYDDMMAAWGTAPATTKPVTTPVPTTKKPKTKKPKTKKPKKTTPAPTTPAPTTPAPTTPAPTTPAPTTPAPTTKKPKTKKPKKTTAAPVAN